MNNLNENEFNFLNYNKQERKKVNKEKILQDFHKITKILIYAFLAPIFILGFFFIECAREAGRSGRGRRR